jgi:hypothetical protein
MTRRILAATVVACIFTASHWARAQQATVFHGDDAKWGPGPSSAPAGAQLVGVVGDPAKEGSYVIRMKAPGGYKVGPHVHPNDENVTVLSGMFHIGFGDTFDESKAQAGMYWCRREFNISRGRARRPSFSCTARGRRISRT